MYEVLSYSEATFQSSRKHFQDLRFRNGDRMNPSQDLSGSLSYISYFIVYISLRDNPKYTLPEIVVYHYCFLSPKAYQNRYQTKAINPGGSRSISWLVDIGVLGLGSRILRPGSSFYTMPKNSGKKRKSLCLTKPKLSISSSHFFLKFRSLYILCFDTLTNNLTLLLVFLDETCEGIFLLYLLELAETVYLKVYGNYSRVIPFEKILLFQGFQTQYGRGTADICMHNEKVNKLITFLSFVQRYQFISGCHY